MDELVELATRWAARLNEAEDEEDNRIGAVIDALLDRIEAQAAEIRSLREQVAQERAGIVAWLRAMENSKMDRIDSVLSAGGTDYNLGRCTAYAHAAAMIERHEDKETRV